MIPSCSPPAACSPEMPRAALVDVPSPYSEWEAGVASLIVRGQAERTSAPDVEAAAVARFSVASFLGVHQVSYQVSDHQDFVSRVDDLWTLVRPRPAV